jgi:hypothetical protein
VRYKTESLTTSQPGQSCLRRSSTQEIKTGQAHHPRSLTSGLPVDRPPQSSKFIVRFSGTSPLPWGRHSFSKSVIPAHAGTLITLPRYRPFDPDPGRFPSFLRPGPVKDYEIPDNRCAISGMTFARAAGKSHLIPSEAWSTAIPAPMVVEIEIFFRKTPLEEAGLARFRSFNRKTRFSRNCATSKLDLPIVQ